MSCSRSSLNRTAVTIFGSHVLLAVEQRLIIIARSQSKVGYISRRPGADCSQCPARKDIENP